MTYKYGMRLRGYSMGCQPMNGFIKRHDDPTKKYYDILEYERELTNEEIETFALDPIQETQVRLANNLANALQHQVEIAYELLNNHDDPYNDIRAQAIAQAVQTTIKALGYNSPQEMGVELEIEDFN